MRIRSNNEGKRLNTEEASDVPYSAIDHNCTHVCVAFIIPSMHEKVRKALQFSLVSDINDVLQCGGRTASNETLLLPSWDSLYLKGGLHGMGLVGWDDRNGMNRVGLVKRAAWCGMT